MMTAELLKFFYRDYCNEIDDEQEILVYVAKTQFLGESQITHSKNGFSCPNKDTCRQLKKGGHCPVYSNAPKKL